jgi:asparagine synthase (glutamine-hydrolysing)
MSAITGIFYRDNRNVDPKLIKHMNDKLSHRGPDDSNLWYEGSVALGHQMLYTTPESLHEKLPFEEDGVVITADARIDNRKELSEKLNIKDNEEVPDSYFILKAYQRWGEKCPQELLGDFTFVIWNKDHGTLFCARDHMGVKPFYYYLCEDAFFFATEIKSLLTIPNVKCKINELEIANILALISGEDREITCYEGIYRLPAAYSLKINSNNSKKSVYWKLDPNNMIILDSDEDYSKKFLEIFTEAVNCRLRSAFPVGYMLSGGLDSSSVACTAQKILQKEGKKQLKTFSAIFDNVPKSNEHYFIDKVLSSSDFDSHYIKADLINPLNEIDKFFWYSDTASIPPNTFMNWNIYREADKCGVRVLLDGFDGDVTVSHGSKFLTELFSTYKWMKFFNEVKAYTKLKKVSYKSIFLSIGLYVLIPKVFQKKMVLRNEYNRKKRSRSRIIKKEFADQTQVIKKIIEIKEKFINTNNAHQYHYLELNSGSIQFETELLDWMSAPFSIEPRHPFYDKRLIEFCLAIPSEQKLSKGWDRVIMRRAMSGILPTEIQWRKDKGDLSFNFIQSLMTNNDLLDDIILGNISTIDKYIDIEEIKKIYNNCKYEDIIDEDITQLWYIVSLYLWLTKN